MKQGTYITILLIMLMISMTATSIHSTAIDIETINDSTSYPQISTTILRQPAEFEPMEAVLIRYPLGLPVELIAEMAEDTTVITIVQGISTQTQVQALYQVYGVNLENCEYLIAPSDTYWTRDYGPWFAFNDDGLSIVDFNYARGHRPNDNDIPHMFAKESSLPITTMPLSHEGGNYMTDGQGIAMSTDLVWSTNTEYSHTEIEDIIKSYLGIETYHVVADVNGEYIRHIDCWGKFLAPTTILIREVPPTHPQYDEIEGVVSYLKESTSCYETGYEIQRIYTPNNEPYTNSLILNHKVFVPMTGSEWDDEAITSYETVMPGYEIHGFPAAPSRPWYSTDALHCRTKGIPDQGMLYINHTPPPDVVTIEEDLELTMEIIPFSTLPLLLNETNIFWKINTHEWQITPIQHQQDSTYTATIPIPSEPPEGTKHTFSYYIQAEDASGRTEHKPYIGKADPYEFMCNNAPETPFMPEGPTSIKKNTDNLYSTTAQDINADSLYYQWDWGDGSQSNWLGPYEADQICEMSHQWSSKGSYHVTVKVKDAFDAESKWSEALIVQVSKTKSNQLFFQEHLTRTISLFTTLFGMR